MINIPQQHSFQKIIVACDDEVSEYRKEIDAHFAAFVKYQVENKDLMDYSQGRATSLEWLLNYY